LYALVAAPALLEFELLAAPVARFTWFAGNVLLGVIIFVIGYWLAGVSARVIRSSDVANEDLLARCAHAAIVVLATIMALRQAGLGEDVVTLAFGLLLGAAAVATAIAFGIGGRDAAHRYVERWTRGTGGARPPHGQPRPPV
jgi:hypothetical protein